MAHFVVTLTTTQARAELSRLEFANRRMALATSAAYKSINFWLKGAVAGFLAMAGAMAASTVIVGEFNKNLTHTAALGALTDGEMDKIWSGPEMGPVAGQLPRHLGSTGSDPKSRWQCHGAVRTVCHLDRLPFTTVSGAHGPVSRAGLRNLETTSRIVRAR